LTSDVKSQNTLSEKMTTKVKVTFLGTGSAFAKTLWNTSILVEWGEGESYCNLLLDCGGSTGRALHSARRSFEQIQNVFISHCHGDHMDGLDELGFMGRFAYKRKARLFAAEGVYREIRDALTPKMRALHNERREPIQMNIEDYFDVSLCSDSCWLGAKRLVVSQDYHSHIVGKPCSHVGLQDSNGKGILWYSGDRIFDRDLITEAAANYWLLLHECQLWDGAPGPVHTFLGELLTLPEEVQRKILLVHYGDNWREFEGRTGQMRFARQGESIDFALWNA